VTEGGSGFIVPIRAVEGLKERMSWLYEHRSECREMGRAARETAENYSVAAHGARMYREFAEILARQRGAHPVATHG